MKSQSRFGRNRDGNHDFVSSVTKAISGQKGGIVIKAAQCSTGSASALDSYVYIRRAHS